MVVGLGYILCFRKWKIYKSSPKHTDQYIPVSTYQNAKGNASVNTAYCSSFQYTKHHREADKDVVSSSAQSQEAIEETSMTQVFDKQWKRLDKLLMDLVKALDRLLHKNDDTDSTSNARRQIVSEWRHVAIILDRFFSIVYLLLIIMSLLFLFPRPPGLHL